MSAGGLARISEAFFLIHSLATFKLSSIPDLVLANSHRHTAIAAAQQRIGHETRHFAKSTFDIGFMLFEHVEKLLCPST